jgi:ketosteroid isomerase-like protein
VPRPPRLLAAALLAACADAAPLAPRAAPAAAARAAAADREAPPPDLRAERLALLAAERARAAASAGGLLGGFPGGLSDDVVFLYPGAPVVRGRAAVEAFLAALPGAAGRAQRWTPLHADVSADGTRGYTYGYGERTAGGGRAYLQYAAFWRRTAGGAWETAFWLQRDAAAPAPAVLPALCAAPTYRHYRRFPHASEAEAEAALLQTDAEFSLLSASAGGGPAFGAYVADYGALLLGNAAGVACGRDEMRDANAGLAPGALTWVPSIADAAPSGDLGATVGVGAFRAGPQTFYSKYLTVWKRERSGAWRFVLDAGNPTPAP